MGVAAVGLLPQAPEKQIRWRGKVSSEAHDAPFGLLQVLKTAVPRLDVSQIKIAHLHFA